MNHVIRYAIAGVRKNGLRTMTSPHQGRNTWATTEEAQNLLKAVRENNRPQDIADVLGDDLAVVRVRCYPGHFDPMGIYFDESDIVSR